MTQVDRTPRTPAQVYQTRTTIVPNQWQGECDCLVGPFSSRSVAEYFERAVVDFQHYEGFVQRVFAKADAWYIEVQKR